MYRSTLKTTTITQGRVLILNAGGPRFNSLPEKQNEEKEEDEEKEEKEEGEEEEEETNWVSSNVRLAWCWDYQILYILKMIMCQAVY